LFTLQHVNIELTCNKSTHLRDALIGHARRLHDLIDYSGTKTVADVQRVTGTYSIPTWLFTLEFANWLSTQFSSCVVNKP